mmetsp:Transcript_100393/g.287279  ORF Transcript_100393/g.287279 Transcript_100393/m.287279 type:complete len:240 (-) Transcript_100393:68-787(-)
MMRAKPTKTRGLLPWQRSLTSNMSKSHVSKLSISSSRRLRSAGVRGGGGGGELGGDEGAAGASSTTLPSRPSLPASLSRVTCAVSWRSLCNSTKMSCADARDEALCRDALSAISAAISVGSWRYIKERLEPLDASSSSCDASPVVYSVLMVLTLAAPSLLKLLSPTIPPREVTDALRKLWTLCESSESAPSNSEPRMPVRSVRCISASTCSPCPSGSSSPCPCVTCGAARRAGTTGDGR